MNAPATIGPRRSASALPWQVYLLAVLTLAYLPLRLAVAGMPPTDALYRAASSYATVLQIIFAVVIMRAAWKIDVDESVGRQWWYIGSGVAMYAIGDIIWLYLESFAGVDPYPSLADGFYVAEYAFFLAAVVLAIKSYSGLVKVKTPIVAGGLVALAGTVVAYFLLLRPYIFPDTAGLELVVSTLYPVGDVAFMLAPAVALALVVGQLGRGRLAWPWWIVVAGALVFALTDGYYSYADWAGIGVTAALDMGWLVANLLFACAALVAGRMFRTG